MLANRTTSSPRVTLASTSLTWATASYNSTRLELVAVVSAEAVARAKAQQLARGPRVDLLPLVVHHVNLRLQAVDVVALLLARDGANGRVLGRDDARVAPHNLL